MNGKSGRSGSAAVAQPVLGQPSMSKPVNSDPFRYGGHALVFPGPCWDGPLSRPEPTSIRVKPTVDPLILFPLSTARLVLFIQTSTKCAKIGFCFGHIARVFQLFRECCFVFPLGARASRPHAGRMPALPGAYLNGGVMEHEQGKNVQFWPNSACLLGWRSILEGPC